MAELGPILRSLRRRKGPSVLFIVEVAVGMAVLSHLFVMGGNYRNMAFSRSGLDEPNVIIVTRRLAGHRTPVSASRQRALADRAALAKVDGVVAAAVVDEMPLPEVEAFPTVVTPMWGEESGAAGDGDPSVGWPVRATDDVVAALGLHCIAGVDFAAADPTNDRSAGRAMVSRSLARHLFGEGSAVGRWIETEGFGRARVVGVLEDFRVRMPFLPDSKSVVVLADLPVSESRLVYVVRSHPGQRERVMKEIAATLGAGAADGPAGDTVELPHFDHSAMRFHIIARGATIVITWTGVIVLGVALVGSLALASFSVAERTRQVGVRRALGARRGHIVRFFLLENALVTSIGLALGLVLTFAINLPVRHMSPVMAVTWDHVVISMLIFWGAGLMSALVPARRAARIPPSAATRSY